MGRHRLLIRPRPKQTRDKINRGIGGRPGSGSQRLEVEKYGYVTAIYSIVRLRACKPRRGLIEPYRHSFSSQPRI